MVDGEIGFLEGSRKEAIQAALDIVKKTGRSTEIIVCKDIEGDHTGGEDCFCGPQILEIHPEDV